MRLINTFTFALEEFFGDSVPPYAILSHTWTQGQEVSFQDWAHLETASKKRGFRKIDLARQQALKDGLDYLWVDTNCINKESSVELSEAINSMFAWYRHSHVCYAYLEDVECGPEGPKHETFDQQFRRSRWFTRGFTLQELLAPANVQFFSREWHPLLNKTALANTISDITAIDESHLDFDASDTHPPSIAQRMSWLSRRSTTRVEDIAYCMLGIFNINMPLLYGEGIHQTPRGNYQNIA
jgi:hypothetical protein